MKIPMTSFVLLCLPLFLNAKTNKTLHLPLVHVSNENYFDYKILTPPLLSPHAYKGLAFIAEIFIGSPVVRQFLHIDTGSTLTWNQCYPCSYCFDHTYPKYWPEDSTTYRDYSYSTECETTESNPKFDYSYSTGICRYKQQYADGSLIQGRLAKEMFTMQTLDGRFEVVHDVYLGCNDQARGQNYIGTGILGLGVGNYSLVEKIGSKFSFCFGQISDRESTHNLILGDGANLLGHPTIINIIHGHYMFQLESILVGEEMTLDNPLQVYLDTGSTISHLSIGLYKDIVDEVVKLIEDKPKSKHPMLCYTNTMDALKIPEDIDIGFIFSGGAELTVNARSLFVQLSPGTLCLAINENPKNVEENIIGAIAMQGHSLGFDLKSKTVYFQEKRYCNM